jgi:hypothetical protein
MKEILYQWAPRAKAGMNCLELTGPPGLSKGGEKLHSPGTDALQRADRFHIVENLIAQAAFADSQRVGYSEITGWGGIWLGGRAAGG